MYSFEFLCSILTTMAEVPRTEDQNHLQEAINVAVIGRFRKRPLEDDEYADKMNTKHDRLVPT